MTAALIAHWLFHPLFGKGYQFWSGIGSDAGEATILTGMVGFAVRDYRRRNCHYKGCWRLSWHPNPETGHPECKKHHPDPHGYLTGKR